MLLLLAWTTLVLCGEDKQGIKHVRLFVDPVLASDVDESFHCFSDNFRKADEAFVLEGAVRFKILHFSEISVESLGLHAMVLSKDGAAIPFVFGSGRLPGSNLVQEVCFELSLSAGVFLFTVYAKEDDSGSVIAEKGRFIVTKVARGDEFPSFDAAEKGDSGQSFGPSNQDSMRIQSEQECINVTIPLLKCEPEGLRRLCVFVEEEFHKAVMIGLDAPVSCTSGYIAGLSNVTVRLAQQREAEVVQVQPFFVGPQGLMSAWTNQAEGDGNRASGLGGGVEQPWSFLPQLQDILHESLFGTAGPESAVWPGTGEPQNSCLHRTSEKGEDHGLLSQQGGFSEGHFEFFVSLVLVAQHDACHGAHAAEALHRLQTSIDLFCAFAIEEGISAEILVVEYNMPSDEQSLTELLQHRTEHGAVPVRVITVPPSVHEQAISLFWRTKPRNRDTKVFYEQNAAKKQSAENVPECVAWTAQRCHELLQLFCQRKDWFMQCVNSGACFSFPTSKCCCCWQALAADRWWAASGESKTLSLVWQGVAKSVGARRARGKFLLFAGSEVAFSRNIFSWMQRGGAREDEFYLLGEREVVRRDEKFGSTWMEQRDNISERSERLPACESEQLATLLTDGVVDLLLVSQRALWVVHAFTELPVLAHTAYMLLRLIRSGYAQMLLRNGVAFHQAPPPASQQLSELARSDSNIDVEVAYRSLLQLQKVRLHTDSSDSTGSFGVELAGNWGFLCQSFAVKAVAAVHPAGGGVPQHLVAGTRAIVVDEPSWLRQHVARQKEARQGKQGGRYRYAVWSCQPLPDGAGPKPAQSNTGYTGCAGLGNRLFGIATVFLYAVLTDRAFFIQWPGSEEVQLHTFFESPDPMLDWRFREMGSVESSLVLDDRIERERMRKVLLTEELTAHHQQAVFLTCTEAFFVDILRNPNNKERLEELGLSHPDSVLGMLRYILTPRGKLKSVVAQVQGQLAPCYVIGIQIRFGTPETGAYRVLYDEDVVKDFLQVAQGIEESRTELPKCVKWFLSTDNMRVSEQLASQFPDKLVRIPGTAAHIDMSSSMEENLKIFADHWLLALSRSIVITIPSTFGFSARLLNLTGSTAIHPVVAAAWKRITHSTLRKVMKAPGIGVECGSKHQRCFCGTMSWAGDLCSTKEVPEIDLKMSRVRIMPIFEYDHGDDGQEFAGLQIYLELVVVAFGDEDALPVASIVAKEAQVKVFVNDEVSSEHGLHSCTERGTCSITAHVPPVLLTRPSCNDLEIFIDPAGSAEDVGLGSGFGTLSGYDKPIEFFMQFNSKGVQETDCHSTLPADD